MTIPSLKLVNREHHAQFKKRRATTKFNTCTTRERD